MIKKAYKVFEEAITAWGGNAIPIFIALFGIVFLAFLVAPMMETISILGRLLMTAFGIIAMAIMVTMITAFLKKVRSSEREGNVNSGE